MPRPCPLPLALALLAAPLPAAAQAIVDLPGRDRPLAVTVEPLFRVGGADAPEWAAFDVVDRVVFDADGRLHILDGRNHRVVVVDRQGRLVRQLGREGEGPGEFTAPRDLAIAGTGELVVLDVLQRRLSRFAPDGAFLDDVPATLGAGSPRRIFGHPAGVVGDVSVLVTDQGPMARSGAGMRPVVGQPIQRYGLEGAGDAHPLHEARLQLRPRDAQGRGYLTRFFPELHVAGLPDGGVAVVDTGAWEVTLVAPEGGVRSVLRRPLDPREVTGAHRDAERERLLEELAAGRAPEAVVTFGGARPSRREMEERNRRRIEDMRFPEHFPQIVGMAADGAGRLWIERMGEPPRPGPVDVVDADGRYLGTLAPGAFTLPLAFGPDGLAAWVETDELDVATVRVGRVRLGPAPEDR